MQVVARVGHGHRLAGRPTSVTPIGLIPMLGLGARMTGGGVMLEAPARSRPAAPASSGRCATAAELGGRQQVPGAVERASSQDADRIGKSLAGEVVGVDEPENAEASWWALPRSRGLAGFPSFAVVVAAA